METRPSQESALVVLVPEAERLVKPFRDKYDPSAARGMPAHITVLYPFKTPQELSVATVTTLQDLFARHAAFTFSLAQLRRFPDILYLAPVPDGPFKELTRVVVKRFPETPPYGGVFGEIIPHLTVAQADPRQLETIVAEFERAAQGQLPVRASMAEVTLMANEDGRWQVRAALRLGRA